MKRLDVYLRKAGLCRRKHANKWATVVFKVAGTEHQTPHPRLSNTKLENKKTVGAILIRCIVHMAWGPWSGYQMAFTGKPLLEGSGQVRLGAPSRRNLRY